MSERITIISSTNRSGSLSGKVALQCKNILGSKNVETQVYNLDALPTNFLFSELYGNRSAEFQSVIDEYITPVSKYIFVIPEYNGGFPGALKTFIDAIPPAEWENKKAGLIGISAGRAGAARATDQFTNVLNYLKTNVYYKKPKLSGIGKLMDGEVINDESTLKIVDEFLDGVMKF